VIKSPDVERDISFYQAHLAEIFGSAR